MSARASRGAFLAWRLLMRSQWREQPLRLGVTVLAIALGVALGAAVYLVNGAALNEFGLATKRLVGEADVVVRGPRDGFSEKLFVQLARESAVGVASPVLELEAALAGKRETLKILGIDPFRAATLQPALIGDIGGNILALFQADGIALSASAAQELKVRRGDTFQVIVGSSPKTLHVLDVLPESSYPEALGLMDIASAQWTFDRIGRLNRIDLRVNPGNDVAGFRDSLKLQLPAGVLAVAPQVERDRAKTVTRAYRVNLNVLALVALWTGAFLVFSTQSLSVLRRRRSLGLLRALGLTQAQLRRALMGEGAALGLLGSLLGVILGVAMAAAILKFLAGDLGNNQLRIGASLVASPLALIAFLAMGTAVSAIGAWVPARAAARQPAARSLKGGDGDYAATARSSGYAGVALLILGAALSRLPPVAGLPVFGYAAIAALLFGAVLLVPALTVRGLKLAPRTHHVVLDTAVAQLRENVGLSTLSVSAIIVSFSLMVAMAIMVYSFRLSFDRWLGKLLPADIQLREPFGNDTAFWSRLEQAKLAAAAGVGRIEFRRTRQLLLDAAHAPVTLISRGATARDTADQLPLVKSETLPLPGNAEPVWISEALQDLYGYRVGSRIDLPLAGHSRRFTVAGVWRDYARTTGSVVMSRQAYVAASGDDSANESSVWLAPGADAGRTEAALRASFARGDSFEILTSLELRERSLSIFDHAFAVTYALEAIAVLIGLTGVSFAASSTALARRAEFGMLRHIGMLRRQVIGMLASEGILTSAFGVTYGLVLGAALSIVLVYVINRQSFNWSIDLAIPGWQLGMLSVALIAAAALTAVIGGRAATSRDTVQAVREDW
jgi:putative ABC transport system permease protein